MAKITVEGYVNERRGKMVRFSEDYRTKDEQGQWGNAGYGNFTLWLKDEQQQPDIQEGAVILVSGDLKVKETEKDGKRYTNLNIGFAKAGVVRLTSRYAGAGQAQTSSPSQSAGQGGWAAPAGAQPSGGNWGVPGQGAQYEDSPPF